MNQQDRFEIQVGRRQVSGFAFALAVPDDDDLKLDSGLRPPGNEGFVLEADELAVNLDANPFPAAARLSDRWEAGKTASVFGLAAPLWGFPFGQRGSEDGIETQAADQRNFHCNQRFEDRLIVVGAVGQKRNFEGNPALDFLKYCNRGEHDTINKTSFNNRSVSHHLDFYGNGYRGPGRTIVPKR